ncbi:TIGR02391 family protein [Desulfurivibrio sp. C05AmB]|uniref:TIGR02391 family protein n=1 Tax=Desulfurivibrio sp. C05AmB TaxID=3374371 RepID=UPI00376F0CE6
MALAGIEYHGKEGITQSCLAAIVRLYQSKASFERVRLLSADERHGFLVYIEFDRIVGIKSGFASGYPGEGPRGLATALRFFDKLDIPITEYAVPSSLLERLDVSALTLADLKKIDQSRPVLGNRWRDYMYPFYLDDNARDIEFQKQFEYEVPMRLIDIRILDLAISLPNSPDAALFSGYRRLEDTFRKRCGFEGEHGARLFAKAFQGKEAALHWPGLDQGENEGRACLFTSVYRAFRNSRAHKEQEHTTDHYLREFLLLNELFRLESTAEGKPVINESGTTKLD